MIRSVAIVFALAVVPVVSVVAATGREVIESAQKKHGFSTWHDRTLSATMATYSGGDLTRTRDLEITEQTDPRGEHRTFISFIAPNDVQGTRFLHLSPRGGSDQQWLFAPNVRRVRRLSEAQRDENFFGADLSYRDLELIVRIQQWNDDESTATLGPEETIDGHKCNVVTLVPKNEEFPHYGKYVLWFGTDDQLLWRVEVFDTDGTLFKRTTLRKYENVGKYATAMESDVETVPNNTRTAFKFSGVKYDVTVDEKVFSVSNLDR
jgi:hypothetical protein